jgi:RNA polymerase sigma-70 factor (ECF subfamily)
VSAEEAAAAVSIEDADEREAPINIADWAPGPVEQLLTRETQQAMSEAIEALPAEFRQVFVLRDLEGHSNADVAEILDLSVAAVKSRLHRARLKVRNYLTRFFNDTRSKAMGAGHDVVQKSSSRSPRTSTRS